MKMIVSLLWKIRLPKWLCRLTGHRVFAFILWGICTTCCRRVSWAMKGSRIKEKATEKPDTK